MGDPTRILVISDGKAGHENQSLGLAEAMARLRPAEIHTLRLDMGKGFLGRLKSAVAAAAKHPRPHFVIAAGHATHPAALLAARKYGARSICLMKPSLPVSWFDVCICPEHDFIGMPVPPNVITSKGALNRVRPAEGGRSGKIFLIGGPSKTHGYDEGALVARIREIAADGGWQVADSRRTPETFLPALKKELPGLTVFPHRETQPGWLAAKLSTAESVWVTEDSVSMIYEALTGGAKVGVLDMPRLRPDARVISGLDALKAEGYFDAHDPPPPLAEADRCAATLAGLGFMPSATERQ
jgi:mitochondrial fission protein ELM1